MRENIIPMYRVIRCAIWYYFYNLKNVKNTHRGELLLVQLKAKACNFTKSNTTPRFSNCTNGTKSRKASHIIIQLTLKILKLF